MSARYATHATAMAHKPQNSVISLTSDIESDPVGTKPTVIKKRKKSKCKRLNFTQDGTERISMHFLPLQDKNSGDQ